MILVDNYFPVYRKRRRALISGQAPEGVLATLRQHSANARVRAHFTEKRLRQMVTKKRSERAILRVIESGRDRDLTRRDPVRGGDGRIPAAGGGRLGSSKIEIGLYVAKPCMLGWARLHGSSTA